MKPDWLLAQLIMQVIQVLPWMLGALAGIAVLSFSPLGRALVKHLRARRADAVVNEQLLGEMEDLRRLLTEVGERLDFAEQRMAQDQAGVLSRESPRSVLPLPPRAITPH